MDGITLFKIAYIINRDFSDSIINKVSIVGNSIVLGMYKGERVNLCFEINGSASLLYLSKKEIHSVKSTLTILNNSVLHKVENLNYDRLIKFYIKKRRQSGKIVEYFIYLEMVGRYANFIVVNDKNKIIYLHNKNNVDSDRALSLGAMYQSFKLNKKHHLDFVGSANSFMDLLGFYPVNAKYAENITKKFDLFYEKAKYLKKIILSDDFFYIDKKMRILPFKFNDYKFCVDLYGIVDLKDEKNIYSDKKKNKIRNYYNSKIKKYIELKTKLEHDLNEAIKFSDIFYEASFLKDNLHILLRKKGEVTLYKYLDNDVEEVDFVISPSVDYKSYVDKLYKKAKKMERSVGKIRERLKHIDVLIKSYKDDLYYLELADESLLNDIYLSIFQHNKPIVKAKNDRFLKYCFNDVRFYVGTSSKVNNELVFKFADSNDLWFHAQNIPSAHLILKKEGAVSDEDIEMAAKIVAYYSKYSNENKVPVDYTLKKYVKRPKGSPDGFVIYDKFRTIIIKPYSIEKINSLKCN